MSLLLGYDTEYYGRKAKDETEAMLARDHCVESVSRLLELHRKMQVPCTFFVLGKLLEVEPRLTKLLDCEFDIQQHLYSHSLVKKVKYRDGHVLTLDQLNDEIVRTSKIIKEKLDLDVSGIRFPYRYQDGFKDDPDILNIVKKNGIEFISSDTSRESQDDLDCLFKNAVQPYHYKNGVLEIPISGVLDTMFVGKKVHMDYVLEIFKNEFLFALKNDLVYAPGFHPWALTKIDPGLEIIAMLVELARDNDVPILSYAEYTQKHK